MVTLVGDHDFLFLCVNCLLNSHPHIVFLYLFVYCVALKGIYGLKGKRLGHPGTTGFE